jgi:hypothetical protein
MSPTRGVASNNVSTRAAARNHILLQGVWRADMSSQVDGWLSQLNGWLSQGDRWLSQGDGWLSQRNGWLS